MNGDERTYRKIRRRLLAKGYHLVRTKGSHYIYKNDDGRTVSVNLRINKMVAQRLIKRYDL